MLLSLWTLSYMDEMKIQSVIPISLGFGFFISSVILRQRDLTIPLWFGRQYLKWGGASLLALVFVGYAQLQRGFYMDEQRKIFLNYQQQLEQDRLAYMTVK